MSLRKQLIISLILALSLSAAYGAWSSVAHSRTDSLNLGAGEFCGTPALRSADQLVRPVQVRLGIDRQHTHPGGMVRARLENFGQLDISYGFAYELARFENGSWIELPRGPFLASLSVLKGGMAGRCDRVAIPDRAPEGLYRISKEISPFKTSSRSPSQRTLKVTFRVRS